VNTAALKVFGLQPLKVVKNYGNFQKYFKIEGVSIEKGEHFVSYKCRLHGPSHYRF
jgi:hypothetical protein